MKLCTVAFTRAEWRDGAEKLVAHNVVEYRPTQLQGRIPDTINGGYVLTGPELNAVMLRAVTRRGHSMVIPLFALMGTGMAAVKFLEPVSLYMTLRPTDPWGYPHFQNMDDNMTASGLPNWSIDFPEVAVVAADEPMTYLV